MYGADGAALAFGGTGDYVSITSNASASLTSGWTAEALVYMDALKNYNGIFSKTNGNAPEPFDMYVDSGGTLNLFQGNGSASVATISATVAAGAWLDIVGTYDGTNLSLYVNGVLAAGPSAQGVTNTDGTNALRLGSRNDGVTMLQGKISLARLWTRALTHGEVKQLYASLYGMLLSPSPYRRAVPPAVTGTAYTRWMNAGLCEFNVRNLQ